MNFQVPMMEFKHRGGGDYRATGMLRMRLSAATKQIGYMYMYDVLVCGWWRRLGSRCCRVIECSVLSITDKVARSSTHYGTLECLCIGYKRIAHIPNTQAHCQRQTSEGRSD